MKSSTDSTALSLLLFCLQVWSAHPAS